MLEMGLRWWKWNSKKADVIKLHLLFIMSNLFVS